MDERSPLCRLASNFQFLDDGKLREVNKASNLQVDWSIYLYAVLSLQSADAVCYCWYFLSMYQDLLEIVCCLYDKAWPSFWRSHSS